MMRVVGVVLVAASAWSGAGCAGSAERAHGEDIPLQRAQHAALLRRPTAPAVQADEVSAPAWGRARASREVSAPDAATHAPNAPAPAPEHPLAAGARAAAEAKKAEASGEPAAPKPVEHAADRKVQVAGIEGTLANFDVRVTMEGKAREFGACHAPRLRRVPGLSGNVEFKIRVLADGSVASVDLPSSDLGDRALERCFTGVIKATQFPKPHGGDANVTYSMQLSPSRPSREPEQWDAERIRHVLQKRADDVREMCELSAPRAYRATVYVNRRGKVVAAGVAGKTDSNGTFDCIADAVRKWPMPKAKKKALAKVTFAMLGTS